MTRHTESSACEAPSGAPVRACTELSTYNRAIARGGVKNDQGNLLSVLAANEIQMLYLMVKWSGCTDEPYKLAGLKIEPKGAFERPTMQHIIRTAKMFSHA